MERRVRNQASMLAAVLLAAVALLAAKAIGGAEGGEGLPAASLDIEGTDSERSRNSQESSAMTRPPKSFVFDRTRGTSDGAHMPGRLIYYEWTGGDEKKSFDRSDPPFKWPKPLKVSAPASIGVEFRASLRPAHVIVQLWDRVHADGSPAGKPQMLTCGVANESAGGCRILRGGIGEIPSWRTILGFSLQPGQYFLSASGVWSPRTPSNIPSTASWIYRVRVE